MPATTLPSAYKSLLCRAGARVAQTRLWQAAFVRPFEDPTDWKKHMTTWLSYAFGILLAVLLAPAFLIDDYLQRPALLGEMQETKGVVLKMRAPRRGLTSFVLDTRDGGRQQFFARSLRRSPLKPGTEVTVWSQPGFELPLVSYPFGFKPDAKEVRLEKSGRYLVKYAESLPWRVKVEEQGHYWYLLMLAVGLFLMGRPVWRHWSPSPPLPHRQVSNA